MEIGGFVLLWEIDGILRRSPIMSQDLAPLFHVV